MNYSPRMTSMAAEVRAELGRQRKTILELSETSGITISTLRRRLDGTSSMTLEELAAIAGALGVTVTTLVERAASAVSA